MAIMIDCPGNESATLEEFVYALGHEIDMSSEDALIACSPFLRRLANNKKFLSSVISARLISQERAPQSMVKFPEPALKLHDGADCVVRAVFWFPPLLFPTSRQWQANSLSYLQPHDHERSFLTVGYYGSGYTTHLYEYDPTGVQGIPGETVSLTPCDSQTISEGRMMIYEEVKDVHTQDHPAEFSITLNVGLKQRRYRKPQTLFDLSNQVITRVVTSEQPYLDSLFRIARHVATAEVTEAIETVARVHTEAAVRLSAWEHFFALCPQDADRILGELHGIGNEPAKRLAQRLVAVTEKREASY